MKKNMDALLLLIIAGLGVGSVASQARRRYHFYYDAKTQPEALDFCREKHTALATISSKDDVNTLRNMADLSQMEYNEHSYRAWIGLYDAADSWRWSLSNQSFYSPGESDFRKWALGQPDNTGGEEHCTLMFDDGGWSDAPCEDHYTPVCCDVTGSTVTFVLVPIAMMWSEAQSYCREHHTDLASVRNMEENQRIEDLVPSGQMVWIGLSRDSWLWLDESDSSFRFWSPGMAEPNNLAAEETCAAADFSNNAEWEDWTCGWRRAYICFDLGITKHVIRLSVQKTNPSVDLNHPTVTAEILKKLAEKLKDDGTHENIRLSWRKQPDGKIFQRQKNSREMEVKC